MSPSRPFILRPVATTLLMVGVLLAGFVAYRQLPVSALPQVDYPTIQVLTFYPGARDRKSTRLNSSHLVISYAVFCLKKKKITTARIADEDTGDYSHGQAHLLKDFTFVQQDTA